MRRVTSRGLAWMGTGWTLTSPTPTALPLPLPQPHPEPIPPIPFHPPGPHSITSLDLTWPDLDSTCPVLSCCLSGLALNLTAQLDLFFSVCSSSSFLLLLLHANTADTPDKHIWTSHIVCRSMRSMSPEHTHPSEVLQRLDLFPDTRAAKPSSEPRTRPFMQASKQSPCSPPTDLKALA